jgi:hypothetical protein
MEAHPVPPRLPPDPDAAHLTAPPGAVPQRQVEGPTTLGDCVRAFRRQPSPPYLFGAVAIALGLRIAQGAWS